MSQIQNSLSRNYKKIHQKNNNYNMGRFNVKFVGITFLQSQAPPRPSTNLAIACIDFFSIMVTTQIAVQENA